MLFCASVGVLVSCEERGENVDIETRHPVADQLLSSTSGRLVSSASIREQSALNILLAGRSGDQRFGDEDGDSSAVFGDLVDGTVLLDGRILLLDGSFGLVRILGSGGRGGVVGGFGEGPGTFVEPTVLVVRDDSLVVVDRSRALHVLTLPQAGLPSWVRSTRLSIEVEDACSMNGNLLALAPPLSYPGNGPPELREDLGVLHWLDGEGTVTASFHVPYRTTSTVVSQSFASGRLLCDAKTQSIVVALSSLGEIHRLSATGEVHWIARLPDYSYPPLVERSTGTVGPARDFSGPIDQVRKVAQFADSLLIVSITSTAVFEPGRPRTHRLVVLRSSDGVLLGQIAAEDVAAVLFGSSSEALVYRDLPYPQVTRIRTLQNRGTDSGSQR